MIVDRFNRIHTYLRISLTDHCNLRCSYCMPDEDMAFTPPARLMQKEEIVTLARLFVAEGVNRIRLTGGEPLVRKDAGEIILGLSALPVSLHITTNATRIHEFIEVLKRAGVRTVNVSLDTLNRQKFLKITRRDYFDRVMENISLLLGAGFAVKINTVLMKGTNDDELNDFVQWTKNEPLHVRFIEFMPFTGNRWLNDQVVTWRDMLERIRQIYHLVPLPGEPHDTAKSYAIPNHRGSVSVISTMSAPFCGSCNRMRLTADGKMKNCLFSTHEADLLGVLRKGGNVRELVYSCIADKAEKLGGQLHGAFREIDTSTLINRTMIAIGG
jgi:cyclic pyranopterin phosphate synthase